MTKTLLATTVALALGATAAFAQSPATRGPVDTDKDGRISRAEAAAHPKLMERFAALDTNKNGYIDANERPQRGQGMRGGKRGMPMLDTDKDGRISRAEAAAHPKLMERFVALDTNRNGYIDATERPQRRHDMHGGKPGMPMLDTDKDGRISRAEAAAHPKLMERFATLDTNKNGYIDASERPQRGQGMRGGKRGMPMLDIDKDGRVSRAEAAAHPKLVERFDMLDANRDGMLTREEFKAAREARRQNAPSR